MCSTERVTWSVACAAGRFLSELTDPSCTTNARAPRCLMGILRGGGGEIILPQAAIPARAASILYRSLGECSSLTLRWSGSA
eukprot:5681464-Pyramimonas_sp.AAC.1